MAIEIRSIGRGCYEIIHREIYVVVILYEEREPPTRYVGACVIE